MNPILKRFFWALLLWIAFVAGYLLLFWCFANSGGGWRGA